ncbi:transcription termination factor 4, mitochondrial isoform X1 [Camelus bactrianus]|uniref:Transcription termination factor 4, mitochondrial isoform X1 n=1 Tax=Camelus bactrianus TaxID=9837 RepID=A0AC58QEY1_CAMBA
MAVVGRQVFDWHRLIPLTWALVARRTPHLGEQKRTAAFLLRKLTTASSGGGLEDSSFAEPRKYVQEPECRTRLVQHLLEKQRTAVEREVTSPLLDMGFSEVHVNELLSIQPGTHPQQLLDIISELILLGLNPEPVYVALKRSPQLLKLPIMQMRKRSSYLRKLGLGEGKLKRVLHCCPEVFTMRQQDIDSIVRVLKEKCLFTVKQVAEILHRCPCVLREDPTALEYKFQMLRAVTQRWHRTKMPRRTRSTRLTTVSGEARCRERCRRPWWGARRGQGRAHTPGAVGVGLLGAVPWRLLFCCRFTLGSLFCTCLGKESSGELWQWGGRGCTAGGREAPAGQRGRPWGGAGATGGPGPPAGWDLPSLPPCSPHTLLLSWPRSLWLLQTQPGVSFLPLKSGLRCVWCVRASLPHRPPSPALGLILLSSPLTSSRPRPLLPSPWGVGLEPGGQEQGRTSRPCSPARTRRAGTMAEKAVGPPR